LTIAHSEQSFVHFVTAASKFVLSVL